MNQEPIYVVAATATIARNFIEGDLKENPRRLRCITRENDVMGLRNAMVFIHPTAHELREYHFIRIQLEVRGLILAHIDDSHHRAKYKRDRS